MAIKNVYHYTLDVMVHIGKKTRWLITSMAIGAIGVSAAWIGVLNSEAYAVASEHIRNAPEVSAKFGVVNDLSLRSFNLGTERANLSLAVRGANASGRIVMQLQKKQEWKVIRVTFEN